MENQIKMIWLVETNLMDVSTQNDEKKTADYDILINKELKERRTIRKVKANE